MSTEVTTDFSTVFNRLCHMVVLSKDEQLDAVVDNLIITAIVTDSDLNVKSADDISTAVEVYFGILLQNRLIESSTARLLDSGCLIPNSDGNWNVDPNIRAATAERIAEAYKLEESVKSEWLSCVKGNPDRWPSTWKDDFWHALQSYMAESFRRHGAETISLLAPGVAATNSRNGKLSSYLLKAVEQNCDVFMREDVVQAIQLFFEVGTPERTRYIAQLLDGTFAFFALNTDEQTLTYLQSKLSSLRLFLDTNFLFGILGLHSNRYDDSSIELINVIKQYNFPFLLYFHQVTFKELDETIRYYGSRLRGRSWSTALSRAITNYSQNEISGIEYAYHERNAKAPISPDVFLARFDSLFDLLKEEHGFTYYNSASESSSQQEARHQLCATYDAFLKDERSREKPYSAIDHDMRLLQAVESVRTDGNSILNAGALFVTIDYNLWLFDWTKRRDTTKLGLTVLPSQLLQLLRPFAVHTPDFNRRFIETFAVPEFRTIRQFTNVTPQIIQFLSAYPDLKETTAIRILSNKVMKQQLEEVVDNPDKFAAIIDQTLLEDYDKLLWEKEEEARETEQRISEQEAELQELKRQEQQRFQTIQNFKQELAETNAKQINAFEMIDDLEGQLQRERQELQRERQEREQEKREREQEKREREQKEKEKEIQENQMRQTRNRWLIGIGIILVGLLMDFVLPGVIHWTWFTSHPKRIGLQILIALLFAGASAMVIAWPKHRQWIFGTVIVGVLLTIAQIIDWN